MKESFCIPRKYDNCNDVKVWETTHFEREAEIVLELITRWGMVAGTPDGEDSSGRSKGRLQTPVELVDRAFITARYFMQRCKEFNLLHEAPSIKLTEKYEETA